MDSSKAQPHWLPPVLAGAIATAAVAVYSAATGFGFVNLDDQTYVYGNAKVLRGLSWDGLAWAFSSIHGSNWHPLTWLSHMSDVQFFGLEAGRHHLVSVLLHAVNAVLLFAWLRRATGSLWRSAAVGLLFAVHPLHVESVAWISERKDVLSTLFWLAAMFAYLEWARSRGPLRYALLMVAFVLGLLAKPMGVTLPFALLLVDAWPLGRFGGLGGGESFDWRRICPLAREKVPLFAIALAASVVTVVAQRDVAASTLSDLPLGARGANALVSCAAYLGNTIWPTGLAAFYPHPSIGGAPHAWWVPALSGVLLVAITGGVWTLRRRCPAAPWGWLWFLGTLVPVIGLLQVGLQARADRYMYIPSIGIFVAMVWLMGSRSEVSRASRIAASAVAIVAIAALGVTARAQVDTWRSSEILWRHAIAVTKRNWAAWAGLGDALHEEGRFQEAMEAGARSMQLRPQNARAWNVVGIALAQLGSLDDATAHLEQAVRLDPRYAEAWYNLGVSCGQGGDHARAARAFTQAAHLDPENAKVWANLAVARSMVGDAAGADAAMTQLERLDPGRAAAMRKR
jgi:Flp pilus assembly protein TadD